MMYLGLQAYVGQSKSWTIELETNACIAWRHKMTDDCPYVSVYSETINAQLLPNQNFGDHRNYTLLQLGMLFWSMLQNYDKVIHC